jgi:Transposase IS66 family
VTERRILSVTPPPGSRRRGFESFVVQDLVLAPKVIEFRRERWTTPEGRDLVAPLPAEVTGHFGPGIIRFILMQHHQGQVTVERIRTQLRDLGVRISKGQIIALLNEGNAAFRAEKEAVLEAGLASGGWVTVDDTGARHAGANAYTTQIGDARFAWFATRPCKSRLNFLELLRAGRPDYVLNATACAYLLEHGVAEAVVATCLAQPKRRFAEEARWQAYLDGLGLGNGHRRLLTEAAVAGAIAEHQLLTDTVIVSDGAGQFDVFDHGRCWIHAERPLRKILCATRQQQRQVQAQRRLIWWFYADLKAYKDNPTPERRRALRARCDRIFRRTTGFEELDATLTRILAAKEKLLRVLDRPDIPLHTNSSETDIRCFVTKRAVSGQTCSEPGKQARDTFLSLLKTCRKLAISFWDYLGNRLNIPEAPSIPWLPDIIQQRAPPDLA